DRRLQRRREGGHRVRRNPAVSRDAGLRGESPALLRYGGHRHPADARLPDDRSRRHHHVHQYSAARSPVTAGCPTPHRSSLLISLNASVSALPRSWKTTVSVEVTIAPA